MVGFGYLDIISYDDIISDVIIHAMQISFHMDYIGTTWHG